MTEIKLQYFKPNGKFYTEGSYMSDKNFMFEIIDEVNQMKKQSELPGVCGNEWIIYVNSDTHPMGYPLLIL